MQILRFKENEKAELALVCNHLKAGNVVVIPTETVYGLAADATNEKAVNKIFEVKGRPIDNPLIVHISNLDMLNDLVREIPNSAQELIKAFWPGPLTIIMKKQKQVLNAITCGLDTVAVRMPNHSIARKIIEKVEVPLAAPSANLSGLPSPTEVKHCVDDLKDKVDFIVDGGKCEVGIESTVISVTETKPVILRPGIITKSQIENILHREVAIDDTLSPKSDIEKVNSPGMKYKHYSPRADVILCEGTYENFEKYILKNISPKTCAMVFENEGESLKIKCFEYGKAENSKSLTKNIFAVLRQIDSEGFSKVFVRMPKRSDANLAIWNRLIRAACFKLINLR